MARSFAGKTRTSHRTSHHGAAFVGTGRVARCCPAHASSLCVAQLGRSSAVPYGPLRGKRNITMDTPSLIKRQQQFFEAMRHKTILLYPDSNRIRHPELRGVMAGLEEVRCDSTACL